MNDFKLVATDDEIDRWVKSRFSDPERMAAARKLAMALRDYGFNPIGITTGQGSPLVETQNSML